MELEELKRIEDLFQAAADLPRGERGPFLDRECGSRAEIRARVEALLAHFDRGAALGPPSASAAPTLARPGLDELAGATVGRYKLLQLIGEGGFGVVYMAEQLEPVRRKVAFKVIKLGMDTKEVVARFEAERQALALMDHPSIAKVLDAGATDSGRPYFVMELIRGVPITEYCDRSSLSARERLELFVQVCRAVHHAHQKGVIHRDLKPSNVMVTLHDTRPVPVVIDFGIAKALDRQLTEKTYFTEFQQLIGTPAYMSPEQAEMSGLDVDVRSDIYSLGVLAYELLTGLTPFDKTSLLAAGFAEIRRILREEEPPRPSTRLSALGERAAEIARQRRLEPAALARLLAGDLDRIVMKALEKDRTRRYQSASSLAADVDRYLADEPIEARPPSLVYKLGKFVRRHRAGVAWAAVVFLALAAGLVGAGRALVQERLAELQRSRAEEAVSFLTDVLSLADPQVALEPHLSSRKLLDHATAQLETAVAGQPRVEARLRSTIGRSYASLAEYELAELHLKRALELYDALAEAPPDETYPVLWDLTDVMFKLERDVEGAFAMADRARRVGHGWIAAADRGLAASLDELTTAVRGHDVEAADRAFDAASGRVDKVLGPGDPRWLVYADTLLDAGMTLWYSPQEAATERYYAAALAVERRELVSIHPRIGVTLSLLVGVLSRLGRLGEAEQLVRESIGILSSALGDEHWQVAASESLLGECLTRQGRFAEAEPLLLASHRTIAEARGPTNFYTLDARRRLADLYEAWGRPEEASRFRDSLPKED